MRKIKLGVIDTCPSKGNHDVFLIGDDVTSFVERAKRVDASNHNRSQCTKNNDWSGKMDYDTSLRYATTGDLSGVAASDKWLSKFESLSATRQAWQTVLDVTGSMPNIPAVLTGHPLSMRRRVRVLTETAPLAVCVDLVSSAGVEAKDLQKRGALILALVRALSATRPVELWCGGSALPYGTKDTHHVWFRLDTAPLDLARAAHLMTSPSVSRGLIYATLSDEAKGEAGLRWPYDNHTWSRANMRPVLSRVIGTEDMLCIAAPHYADELVNQPETWFDNMLKQYGGVEHDA